MLVEKVYDMKFFRYEDFGQMTSITSHTTSSGRIF